MKEVTCYSGAVLKITLAPFADSKALYQAFLQEAKGVQISSKMEMANLYKELFCGAFSSPEIEKRLWACFKRCTYNSEGKGDLKIDEHTFEPVVARGDYNQVCLEVAKENLAPFTKDLFALLGQMFSIMQSFQA